MRIQQRDVVWPPPRSGQSCRPRSPRQAVVAIQKVGGAGGIETRREFAPGRFLYLQDDPQLFFPGLAVAVSIHRRKANHFPAVPGQNDGLPLLGPPDEISQLSFGKRKGDMGRRRNMDQSVVQFKIQPPTTCIPSHSAIRAGLSAPSISTVTSCFSSQRPPPLSSADRSLNRPRTFDPAGTGARKRSLSKP